LKGRGFKPRRKRHENMAALAAEGKRKRGPLEQRAAKA
jgi:hypothetical protein